MTKRTNGKRAGATLPTDVVTEQGLADGRMSDDGWATLRKAAEETGVSISTLRNWYRKGLIDSRVEKGPNGSQRIVRLDEVVRRTRAQAERSTAAGTSLAGERAGRRDDVGVSLSLQELIAEQAAARERAGRAEARCEFLEREIDELRKHLEGGGSERQHALEAENRMLRERLDLMRGQAEEMARRLSYIEGEPDEIDLDDDAPRIPPPEEDEFLALTQRWRARRKRRRAARRDARRAAKAASSSSSR